jgi:hypothetical protein
MLQNAVNGIDELRHVKNTADQMATTNGSTPTYNEYTTLLLSAAAAYNDQFKHKKSRRNVSLQDLHDDHDCVEMDHIYDINYPAIQLHSGLCNQLPV